MNGFDNIKRTQFIFFNTKDPKQLQDKITYYSKFIPGIVEIIKIDSFSIIMFLKSNHILHKTIVKNVNDFFIFLDGDFYEEIDEDDILNNMNYSNYKNILLNTNGSFNCLIYHNKKKEVILYNDIIGLKKYFYGFVGNDLVVSSLLSVFYQSNIKYNDDFVKEYIFARIPFDYETQFSKTYTVPPDGFIKINIIQETVHENIHIRFYEEDVKSKNEILENIYNVFQDFLKFVYKKKKKEKVYCTLTGGADTRILLNMLINSGYNISGCLTDFNYSINNTIVAKKICQYFNLNLYNVRKKNNKFNKKDVDRLNYITNGLRPDVVYPVNIYNPKSIVFYGAFGNFLSRRGYGLHRELLNSKNRDVFIEKFFKFIFPEIHIDVIKKTLNPQVFKRMKERFRAIFEIYFKDLNLEMSYYYFYKNFRNFYNDARFAAGSYIGASGIFPFNNLQIISLYNTLSLKDKYSHWAHFKLSYYNNPKLATFKMGHFSFSIKFKPWFIWHISEKILKIKYELDKLKYSYHSLENMKQIFSERFDIENYSSIYDLNLYLQKLSKLRHPKSFQMQILWLTSLIFNYDELCKKWKQKIDNMK
ncbi:hypothetical protein K8R66_00955 [bacterium]|nr:hypothetical protein [bacterium]